MDVSSIELYLDTNVAHAFVVIPARLTGAERCVEQLIEVVEVREDHMSALSAVRRHTHTCRIHAHRGIYIRDEWRWYIGVSTISVWRFVITHRYTIIMMWRCVHAYMCVCVSRRHRVYAFLKYIYMSVPYHIKEESFLCDICTRKSSSFRRRIQQHPARTRSTSSPRIHIMLMQSSSRSQSRRTTPNYHNVLVQHSHWLSRCHSLLPLPQHSHSPTHTHTLLSLSLSLSLYIYIYIRMNFSLSLILSYTLSLCLFYSS